MTARPPRHPDVAPPSHDEPPAARHRAPRRWPRVLLSAALILVWLTGTGIGGPYFGRVSEVSSNEQANYLPTSAEATQVQALLGQPLKQSTGPRGQAWDYNLKFRVPRSNDYLVCQYKVVFNEQQAVRESVWRRRQCKDLAG